MKSASYSDLSSALAASLSIEPASRRPNTSAINYATGDVVNNEIIAKLSRHGTICIFAATTTHLVIDATGSL